MGVLPEASSATGTQFRQHPEVSSGTPRSEFRQLPEVSSGQLIYVTDQGTDEHNCGGRSPVLAAQRHGW